MRYNALISTDGTYRYYLSRSWDDGPTQVWIMLNPSTADHLVDDPTISRLITRARSDGFGGIEVVNLFALRSTDPKLLKTHIDPVGPENDANIFNVMFNRKQIVCAWGNHGSLRDRDKKVITLIKSIRNDIYVLGISKKGQPIHPLYVSMTKKPIRWNI